MKSRPIGSALLAVAASLALGTLSAQAHPGHKMHKVDSNGDGVVDFNEMQAARPELTLEEFNKMDANSDGQLAREELFEAHMAKRMKKIDTNGDGAISMEEMEAHRPPRHDPAEHFQKFDTDDDGKLTRDELEAMQEEMSKHMPAFVRFRHGPKAEESESDTK